MKSPIANQGAYTCNLPIDEPCALLWCSISPFNGTTFLLKEENQRNLVAYHDSDLLSVNVLKEDILKDSKSHIHAAT